MTVAPCSRKAAEHAVMTWHYSRKMPVGKIITLGVWEGGRFIGAVIYGRGASPKLLEAYGITQAQGCELVRVALNKHEAPVSQIVAKSLVILKQTNPGLRLVVSFADPAHGHHGGIYQAGNWLYSGTSLSSQQFLYKGKVLHRRQVTKSGYIIEFGRRRQCPTEDECEIVNVPGKHRYLMPLDKAMRRRVSRMAKPYPLG